MAFKEQEIAMKFIPLLFISFVLTFGVVTAARADLLSGIYMQGNAGYSRVSMEQEAEIISGIYYDKYKISNDNVSYRVALGKDFGNIRVALDYSDFGDVQGVYVAPSGTVWHNEYKTSSVGLSGYYDFDDVNVKGLTPYVGACIARHEFKERSSSSTGAYYREKGDDVGFGVMAGVQYQLMPNVLLDANIEYSDMGKHQFGGMNVPMEFSQFGITVGARYNF